MRDAFLHPGSAVDLGRFVRAGRYRAGIPGATEPSSATAAG